MTVAGGAPPGEHRFERVAVVADLLHQLRRGSSFAMDRVRLSAPPFMLLNPLTGYGETCSQEAQREMRPLAMVWFIVAVNKPR